MTIYVDNIHFETHQCGECGMPFAMTTRFKEKCLKDGTTFYCPAGHGRVFVRGQTEEEKLRKQLERERQMLEAAHQRAASAERKRDEVARAHLKMRARVMNGVCPCCNRTFQNLMNHMRTEHAGEINLRNIRNAYGMTQHTIADEIGVNMNHVSAYEREKPVPRYAKERIETWMATQEKVT